MMDVSGEENVKSEESLDIPSEEVRGARGVTSYSSVRNQTTDSRSDKLNLTVLTFCPRK